MATYKVIQDIEAEDKLIGPMTLRQFIYAIIVLLTGFVAFKLIQTPVWFIALLFLPVIVFFAVLAAPFGHDQSSEIWLLAKVRFFFKPRKRIWDQSGLKELVTITVPKKIEKHLTNELSQTEVRSRLQALANTIDSRGWAVKNINVNMFSEPSYVTADTASDRLLDPNALPQDVPAYDVQATDDIFDERSNTTAQHLEQLMTQSAASHKQQIIQQMQTPPKQAGKGKPGDKQQADYWFLNGPVNPQQNVTTPGYTTFNNSKVIIPGQAGDQSSSTPAPTADEKQLIEKVYAEKSKPNPAYGHMRTIQPISAQQEAAKKHSKQDQPTVTATPNPAIIELANNDDLNVSTIARQANKASGKKPPDDEVVISLR